MTAMVGFQLFYNGSFSFSSQVSPEMVVSHWWQGWIKIASTTVVFEFIAGMFLAELMVNDKIKWISLHSCSGVGRSRLG